MGGHMPSVPFQLWRPWLIIIMIIAAPLKLSKIGAFLSHFVYYFHANMHKIGHNIPLWATEKKNLRQAATFIGESTVIFDFSMKTPTKKWLVNKPGPPKALKLPLELFYLGMMTFANFQYQNSMSSHYKQN